MVKRMLIDASHPEETRVVVLNGNRLEEFDYESAARSQLKGNIYLAKVTRVEPSLQAAFVEYGGNRHGFLPFSEIHPDYYRIPIADREALLAEQARFEDDAGEESEEGLETEGVEAEGEDDSQAASTAAAASAVVGAASPPSSFSKACKTDAGRCSASRRASLARQKRGTTAAGGGRSTSRARFDSATASAR